MDINIHTDGETGKPYEALSELTFFGSRQMSKPHLSTSPLAPEAHIWAL
jgi:hypothetical protein